MLSLHALRTALYVFPLAMGLFDPAYVAASGEDASAPAYYGADLDAMTRATGVDFRHPEATAPGGPWPQRTDNYCFISAVQAIANYDALESGKPLPYPAQSGQGPASDNPEDATQGQILYDMDHALVPPGGPLKPIGAGKNRKPFTLANIAYDSGGDPRAQAAAVAYETGASYHEHIYHNGAEAATQGIAQALATYRRPVIALVNHGLHSVVIAGVWAKGDPAKDPHARIEALAIYNPWDRSKGHYLSQGYYERVSYKDWVHATSLPSLWKGKTSWFALPYQENGGYDPDPAISRYEAGAGTSHPGAHHWISNYVFIQRDEHAESADYTFDEHDKRMEAP